MATALRRNGAGPALAIAALIGAGLPDLDMLWFYLVDDRGRHHHLYLTHRPLIWAAVLAVGLSTRRAWGIGLGIGALLHVALDTPLGAVNWAWPLGQAGGPFLEVPATQSHYLLSFILHWTFLAELVITGFAGWVFLRSRRRGDLPWRDY